MDGRTAISTYSKHLFFQETRPHSVELSLQGTREAATWPRPRAEEPIVSLVRLVLTMACCVVFVFCTPIPGAMRAQVSRLNFLEKKVGASRPLL